MRNWIISLVGVLFVSWAAGPVSAEMVLAEGGQSDYRIVMAEGASPSERHAAQELQHFLHEMTGATLAIATDAGPISAHEILLGDNEHLRKLGIRVDFAALGDEGYVIQTFGDHLVIAGGRLRGTMYGVYGLLEDHLGCRWFTPKVSRIPKRDHLTLGDLNDRQIPPLEYRELLLFDNYDGDWMARNRMNGSRARLEEKHGGKIRFGRGFFVHTFNRLVPPDKYFDEHPEYFSLIDGKRVKDHSQLCTTNEDVIRLCTQGILQAMRDQPDAFVFSVSQNDRYNFCQCDNCQALAEREGSQMAPVLHLVNRVAEAVEKEFPDKVIETLAYQWTRKAPKTMRPRPNVIVRLCSIECCFSHPLATCDSEANVAFRRDMDAWARVGNRLWVWNYGTAFHHYLLPFPNQFVRAPNIRFYVAHNVKGIMEQDTHNTADSELAELGGYITAKFLWNPNYDRDTAINEFLAGYYGPAASTIRAYIDLIHAKVIDQNIHMGIWVGPDSPHQDDDLLSRGDALWARAEAEVANDPELLHRVRLSRMSVDYAILERARRRAKTGDTSQPRSDALARKRFSAFFDALSHSEVTRIEEWKLLDPVAYRKGLATALGMDE